MHKLKDLLKRFSKQELILTLFAWGVMVVGFVFLILGIVASYLPVDHPLPEAQANFSWRYLGLIIIASGAVIYLGTLLFFAKQTDRVFEKEKRRKQRLEAMMSDYKDESETVVVGQNGQIEESKPATTTIAPEAEVNTKPVEEHNTSLDNAVIDAEIKGK
ncbi:MAG: hypothetical protein MJ207_02620 [Bacilli bacterium]|nr:hypothetical protein [Bacilli bacterium]